MLLPEARVLADERQDQEPDRHRERQAEPRPAVAARPLDARAEDRWAERDAERGDRKAEAHGGGGGAGARQLGHQRVLDAVPADPEEPEDDRERYQPARGRRRPCERDRDRAERRAAAGDREWRTAPAPECPVGERSEERRVGKECRSRWSPY